MAVYGSLIREQSCAYENTNISFDELIGFVYESDNDINQIFEKLNIISLLQEDNTSLAIPKSISEQTNSDNAKKTVVEKIK